MRSSSIVAGIVVGFTCAALLAVPPPPAAKRAHADKNKDGVVTPREMAKEKQFEHNKKAIANKPWEKAADADHDGKVELAEIRAFRREALDVNNNGIIEPAERRAYWVNRRAIVNTPFEKLHDLDGNGIISWDEAVAMFKDFIAIVKTNGKAIVNSPIEYEFDLNKDGVIDGPEAEALLKAIETP